MVRILVKPVLTTTCSQSYLGGVERGIEEGIIRVAEAAILKVTRMVMHARCEAKDQVAKVWGELPFATLVVCALSGHRRLASRFACAFTEG